MSTGRTKKAILNIGSNFFVQIIKTILTFITRTIFIYCLGMEVLGLNGLFTNILSMLSLAELGVGTAINFSLYEPLAKNNNTKISSLMTFYKKAYRIIGIIVLLLGIILMPFLKFLIRDFNSISNSFLIYILFLVNTVSSYFISYKETLIIADQKNYKLTFINTIFIFLLNILQIIGLLLFRNFIIYLCIQFIVQFMQRIVINFYITSQYKNIDFNSRISIDKKDYKLIVKNVKAMFFHKIGDYCVNGTDNLIISSFISINMVGIYSNYLTVLTLLTTFTTLFFNNLTSSLGNLIVTEANEKKYDVFKKMNYICFIMYGFCSVILINIFNDFIVVWVGNDYCLSFEIVVAIVFNFYITGMRIAPYTLKSASGMYDIDKYTPLLQATVNLVVSILLVRYIGLLGVILGTIISCIILPAWQRPYIVYKHIINKPFKEYIVDYLKKLGVLIWILIISFIINNYFISLNNLFLLLILKFAISSIIYCIIIIFFYGNCNEHIFLVGTLKKFINRRDDYEKKIS